MNGPACSAPQPPGASAEVNSADVVAELGGRRSERTGMLSPPNPRAPAEVIRPALAIRGRKVLSPPWSPRWPKDFLQRVKRNLGPTRPLRRPVSRRGELWNVGAPLVGAQGQAQGLPLPLNVNQIFGEQLLDQQPRRSVRVVDAVAEDFPRLGPPRKASSCCSRRRSVSGRNGRWQCASCPRGWKREDPRSARGRS